MKKEDKIKEIKKKITQVLRKNKIKKAGIFGSYARGEETEKSDIDILVEIDGSWSLIDLANLKINLEKLLSREVDLVEYNLIKPEIKSKFCRRKSN